MMEVLKINGATSLDISKYLLSWITIVAPIVGLRIPVNYFK